MLFLRLFFWLIVAGFAFPAGSSAQTQPDPNFHLYILMGQSNMAGRGVITDSLKKEGNARVFMLDKNGDFIPAKHPVHFDKPRVAGVGPGLAFGIKMAQDNPKVKIGLIPCAVGGSPIDHWQAGAYDEATKTHPYDDAVLRIKNAMKFGVIKGVLWHQGESDSSPEKSAVYLKKLEELILRVRKLSGNPHLPFIVGQLARYRPIYQNINTQLEKLPAEVPFTALVSSERLTHKGDTTHFNGPSADEFGRRFAIKMEKVQQKKSKVK